MIMKVKIGDKVFDSTYEPIAIQLTETDKNNIGNMTKDASVYICFPVNVGGQRVKEWAEELKIKRV